MLSDVQPDLDPVVTPRRLSHLGIRVVDLERSLAFYERVLGFRLLLDYRGGVLPGHETVVGVIGDVAVELIHDDDRPAPAELDGDGFGFSCVSFSVDDVDAALEALRAAGLCDQSQPIQFPAARVVFFRDPDHNLLELIELPGDATALAEVRPPAPS